MSKIINIIVVLPKRNTKWVERTFAHAGPSLGIAFPQEILSNKSVEVFTNNLKNVSV